MIVNYRSSLTKLTSLNAQATSNRVPWEEHGTYPLNLIEGNHHGTNQSEMHQT